jgi:signal transduction histidine kinase
MLRKKKVWEVDALRAAKKIRLEEEERRRRLEEEEAKVAGIGDGDNAEDDAKREIERTEQEARDIASAKSREIRSKLNALILQQTELQTSIAKEWKDKIDLYEQQQIQEEESELNKLKEEQNSELKKLMEEVRAENELEEKRKAEALKALLDESDKRGNKREREEGEGEEPSNNKRRKTSEDGEVEEMGEIAEGSKDDDDGKKNSKAEEGEEKESAKKGKELESILDEVNHLNKTKSQMVWLLKQVITQEAKMKLKKPS